MLPIRRLLVLALFLAAPPVAAEDRVPASAAEIQLSFAPVVKATAQAVVNIYATRLVAQRVSPFADDPFFSQFFGLGQMAPQVQNALGSGVILRDDGIVVSNYHVVGDARDIRVVLADRREFDATVLLADQNADLAILQLQDASDLPALEMADSDAVEVGDLVLAIGNPFGVGQTVTMGIVSGLARSGGSLGRGYYIQTDAAINPGNSGGALVDMAGRLVGVNTSILSRSGGSQGVGFAIPANLVRQYVLQAEAGKTALDRPWLGAAVQTVDSGMAQAIGLPAPHGVAITQLHPQSPLLAAGLAVGDVVLAIDGAPIDSPQELDFRLTTLGVGATADIDFWRDGAGTQASLVLIAAPGGDGQQVPLTGAGVFDGLVVADLSPAMIDRLGLALDSTGVAVVDVTGQAQRMQLAPGDVIVSVNGTPIASVADLEDVARGRNRDWQIEFERGQQHLLMRLRRG